MPANRCTRHVHRGPQDFRPDGRCIHCSREAQRDYRKRRREAKAVTEAAEIVARVLAAAGGQLVVDGRRVEPADVPAQLVELYEAEEFSDLLSQSR